VSETEATTLQELAALETMPHQLTPAALKLPRAGEESEGLKVWRACIAQLD